VSRGGVTVGVQTGLDDLFELWRQADVETMPYLLAQTSPALVAGAVHGMVARAKVGGTYTKCGFTVGAAFTGATDLRLGVWAATLAGGVITIGAKLTETANLGALAAGVYRATALGAGVTLAPGAVVILGMAGVGFSAGQVRGFTAQTADAGNHPLVWGATGYAGGALPSALTQAGAGSGIMPRLMLLP
jgi:hypothetical protein